MSQDYRSWVKKTFGSVGVHITSDIFTRSAGVLLLLLLLVVVVVLLLLLLLLLSVKPLSLHW